MKKNCWEVMKCGRQAGGLRSRELGICPASTEARLDGSHGGRNAGRACWVVSGTLCKGEVQGMFARKYGECSKCAFYGRVKGEERSRFVLSATLLAKVG